MELRYCREVSKTICPQCGSKGELVFRFHCTNEKCRSFVRGTVLIPAGLKVGDRVRFLRGTRSGSDPVYVALISFTQASSIKGLSIPASGLDSKPGMYLHRLFYLQGTQLDGHESPILKHVYDKWACVWPNVSIDYNHVWLPLEDLARYE